MSDWDLTGYKPEVPKSTDFDAFKYSGPCHVNYARIEPYQGTFEDSIGCEFFNYELVVLEGENEGRKLWGKFNLDKEDTIVNGKTRKCPRKKLADQLFTLDLEFTNKEGLAEVAKQFVDMVVDVKAWYFKGQRGDNVQQHLIKGKPAEKWEEGESQHEF